ncbi:dipeptide ABC transporter ATP-binding protein [bacterium]|nr:dipeptide ABC transporter ATP-binding protein [bacterium]
MTDAIAARISGLNVEYALKGGLLQPHRTVKAVQDVSFELRQGEILALVGESGCGKSSLGKAILRLVEPKSGQIEIAGLDFRSLRGSALRKHRSLVQMIFQDPYASLDPRMTVWDILAEPLQAHNFYSKAELQKRIDQALELVGLPLQHARRYPHEFSGGQRQRIAIARALILQPKVIIADEPVSSLDVSVQAQILNLLKDIQQKLNLSLIFISHNLAVVKYLADRIGVMYLGRLVEIGSREEIFTSPKHPYTQALLSAVPIPDPRKERARPHNPLKGEIPSPVNPPAGCAFHTRCPIAMDVCKQKAPQLVVTEGSTQRTACWAVHPN